MYEPLSLVQDGTIDFAIMNTEITGTLDNLLNKIIVNERFLLMLHRDSPIAQEFIHVKLAGQKIDLHLLERERFISLN